MKYPINYDFGRKWHTDVVPHLDNPLIQKAIKRGVNNYLSMFPTTKRYKPNTAPASYSSNDCYVMLTNEKWKYMYRALKENNMVPKKIIKLKKKLSELDDEEYNDLMVNGGQQVYDTIYALQKEYFTWEMIKDDLETYYLSGACFWWAPTFELELAELVEPNEKWSVVGSAIHATVMNKERTKVFDLLYWAADWRRMRNYLFGEEFDDDDPTLGGKMAYEDTMRCGIKNIIDE